MGSRECGYRLPSASSQAGAYGRVLQRFPAESASAYPYGPQALPRPQKRRFAGRAFRTVCGMTGHGQTVAAARHRYDDADVGPRPGICFGNLAAGKPFLVKRVSAAHEQNVTACEERFFTKV